MFEGVIGLRILDFPAIITCLKGLLDRVIGFKQTRLKPLTFAYEYHLCGQEQKNSTWIIDCSLQPDELSELGGQTVGISALCYVYIGVQAAEIC